MLATLVALYCWTPRPAEGQGGTVFTTTTSTTHGTTHSTAADCVAHTETSVTTTTTIGPATILIGEDQSVTFFVPAGTLNINTNTHTQFFVCDPAAAIPVLSPVGLIGLAAGLAGFALYRLRRFRSGDSRPN